MLYNFRQTNAHRFHHQRAAHVFIFTRLYKADPSGRGLRRGSAAARLLRLWVRIPPGAWMSVCCECCVVR